MPRALYQLSRPLTTFRQQFSLHPPARYIHKMAMSTSMLPKVILNDNETRLARLLVECADWIDQHPEQVDQLRLRDEQGQWIGKLRTDEKVELRIAGGWVRDKASSSRARITRARGPCRARQLMAAPHVLSSFEPLLTDISSRHSF